MDRIDHIILTEKNLSMVTIRQISDTERGLLTSNGQVIEEEEEMAADL